MLVCSSLQHDSRQVVAHTVDLVGTMHNIVGIHIVESCRTGPRGCQYEDSLIGCSFTIISIMITSVTVIAIASITSMTTSNIGICLTTSTSVIDIATSATVALGIVTNSIIVVNRRAQGQG